MNGTHGRVPFFLGGVSGSPTTCEARRWSYHPAMKTAYDIELNDRQHEYLERMAKKHDLPDLGKAVRVIVDFAMHEPDEESRIFGEMRCSGC